MTMTRVSRRSLVKGAAGVAAGAAIASKRSTSFAAPAVLKQSGPIEVLYWGAFADALGESESQIVQMFNDSQTDVKLKYETNNDYETNAQKLTAALSANQAPDIALLSDVWWFKFYLAGALAPLDDFIAANNVDTADFQESLYIEGQRNGHVWWLPFARSTPLFYFNKTAYEEAGLSGPPKTWSEFAEIAPSLVKKDGDNVSQAAFAHPSSGSYIAWLFQGVTWAFGGSYSDADFNILIDQGGAIDAGEYYRASVADGWATTPDDIAVDFQNGLTASMTASTGGIKGILANVGDKFEVGTTFLLEEKGFGCSTGGSGLAIIGKSAPEKQEAAFKFIEYVTSTEGTTWWSQNTGYMPVRKSAVESQSMQDFFAQNPNFKTAVDQLPKTKPQDSARVFIPNGDQIIGKGLEAITVTNQDAASAFADVKDELEAAAEPVLETLSTLEA